MPAVSKQQRKFMGLVHAVQQGKVPASKVSKSARDAAKQMKKKDVEDFASTDEKGLPTRKTESGILYRAGVKKYGKEGMRKIQQAAGKRKSHAVIGAIKDKYEKDKKESANEAAPTGRESAVGLSGNKDLVIPKNQMSKAQGQYKKMMNYLKMVGKSMTQPGEIDTMVMHMESAYDEMLALWKNVKVVNKESVNESIELPHSMELGKVFTGHGKSFVKEEVEPAGNMAKIQKIVKDSQATKLGGVMIDMQSANLLMKVYNAVSDKDKEKMNKLNPKVLIRVIEKLWSRVKLKLPI